MLPTLSRLELLKSILHEPCYQPNMYTCCNYKLHLLVSSVNHVINCSYVYGDDVIYTFNLNHANYQAFLMLPTENITTQLYIIDT